MKKYVLLLLVAASCQKSGPAADEEFEVQTRGANMDCGLPMVEVVSAPDRVAALLGASNSGSVYIAYNLDPALWQSKSQRLLIKIRKPLGNELTPCTMRGPGGYPRLTVLSARVK